MLDHLLNAANETECAQRARAAERDLERTAAAIAQILHRLAQQLSTIFAVGRVVDFRAEHLVEQSAGAALARLAREEKDGFHPQLAGDGRRQPDVMRVRRAGREQRVAPVGERAAREILELSDLAASKAK